MVKKIIPDILEVAVSKTGKKRKALLQPPVRLEIRTGADSDSSDAKAALDWLSSINPTSEGRAFEGIRKLEEQAKRVLIKEGLEPSGQLVLPPCTPSWYANEMLIQVRFIRGEIERGEFFEAILTALKLATALGDLNFATFQPETLIGIEKVRDGKGSGKYTEAEKDGWLNQAKALLESNSTNYRHANGKPHYKNISVQIGSDESLSSHAEQSIYVYLLANKEKI